MNQEQYTPEDIKKNKDLAALSYLWLFSLVILVARKDSPFIRMHAKQGVVLFVLSILLWYFTITRYGEFIILALMILGFVEAVNGRPTKIPVIADISEGKITITSFKKAWHSIKHTAIKIFKPEHVTPEYKEVLREQDKEMKKQEEAVKTGEKMVDLEEKKLSSLARRLNEDENELHKLEDQVHNEFGKIESDVERIEKKIDAVIGQK